MNMTVVRERKGLIGMCLSIVKFLLMSIINISIFLTILITTISISIHYTIGLSFQAMYPNTPKYIGIENLTQNYLSDMDKINREYSFKDFIVPYEYINNSEVSKKLYSHFTKDIENDVEYQKEINVKKNLIKMMCNTNSDEVEILADFLSFLPIEFLKLMYEDNLKLFISDELPTKVNDEAFRLAYYDKGANNIVFTNFEDSQKTAIHEIGHWFEKYLEENIDYYYSKRISKEMIEELDVLNLVPYTNGYAKTNLHETFAVLFELFIHDYEKVMFKAPITFEYFTYYLNKVLIEKE